MAAVILWWFFFVLKEVLPPSVSPCSLVFFSLLNRF